MSPEERELLERALKISEDNNRILQKMERAAQRAALWGFIKLLIIVVPLVIGYIFLQPYFGPAKENYNSIKELLETSRDNQAIFERFLSR